MWGICRRIQRRIVKAAGTEEVNVLSGYEENWTLEEVVWAAIENYDHDRSEYLDEFTEDEKRLVDVLEALGRDTLKGLENLNIPEGLAGIYRDGRSVKGVLDGIDKESVRNVAIERIEIELARNFSTDVRRRAERALQLSELFLDELPAEPALRFLRRLVSCFVAGFLPECVMLCRAILENAIKETFDRKEMEMPEKQRDRFDVAYEKKWLSYAGKRAAHDVWTRGNKAIHDDPAVTRDVLGTVQLCTTAIKELTAA